MAAACRRHRLKAPALGDQEIRCTRCRYSAHFDDLAIPERVLIRRQTPAVQAAIRAAEKRYWEAQEAGGYRQRNQHQHRPDGFGTAPKAIKRTGKGKRPE